MGFLIFAFSSLSVRASELAPVVITLQNHHFSPREIHIPSGKKAVLLIKNLDPSREEFESAALKISQVIGPKSEAHIVVPATEHGHYTFVGEYHEKIARGVIVVD